MIEYRLTADHWMTIDWITRTDHTLTIHWPITNRSLTIEACKHRAITCTESNTEIKIIDINTNIVYIKNYLNWIKIHQYFNIYNTQIDYFNSLLIKYCIHNLTNLLQNNTHVYNLRYFLFVLYLACSRCHFEEINREVHNITEAVIRRFRIRGKRVLASRSFADKKCTPTSCANRKLPQPTAFRSSFS